MDTRLARVCDPAPTICVNTSH